MIPGLFGNAGPGWTRSFTTFDLWLLRFWQSNPKVHPPQKFGEALAGRTRFLAIDAIDF